MMARMVCKVTGQDCLKGRQDCPLIEDADDPRSDRRRASTLLEGILKAYPRDEENEIDRLLKTPGLPLAFYLLAQDILDTSDLVPPSEVRGELMDILAEVTRTAFAIGVHLGSLSAKNDSLYGEEANER